MRYLSQLKPSTLSLQTHRPVSTLHSSMLPEGLHEHGLSDAKWNTTMREENATLQANPFVLYVNRLSKHKKYTVSKMIPQVVSVFEFGFNQGYPSQVDIKNPT